MLAAVYELLNVTPHQPDRRSYSRVEWPIYREGYECALGMALRVMGLALDRSARREADAWRARADAASRYLRRVVTSRDIRCAPAPTLARGRTDESSPLA